MLHMMSASFPVTASAGSLRAQGGTRLTHAWTEEGISADPVTNGAQVLHLAVATCVLNDLYREASASAVSLDGVRVTADGGFDEAWRSTGITYTVEVASSLPSDELARLLAQVDEVAEIPRALRAGVPVSRLEVTEPGSESH